MSKKKSRVGLGTALGLGAAVLAIGGFASAKGTGGGGGSGGSGGSGSGGSGGSGGGRGSSGGGFGAGLARRDTLGFGLVPGNACRFFFLSGLRLGRGVRFFWSRLGHRLGNRWGGVGGRRNGECQRGRFWSAWRWSVRRASRRGGRVGWSLPFFHQFRDENHGQRGNDGGADQALG